MVLDMEMEDSKVVFKQRSFFETRIFRLYKDRINVRELRMFGNAEYTKSFEVIFNERMKIKSYPISSVIGLTASVLVLSLFAYFLRSDLNIFVGPAVIFGIVIILFGIHVVFSYKRFIGYDTDTKPLLFFENLPTREKFEEFLGLFEKQRKAYLSERYGNVEIDKNVASGITQLLWLKERGALTEEEFQIAKNKLLNTDPPEQWVSSSRFN